MKKKVDKLKKTSRKIMKSKTLTIMFADVQGYTLRTSRQTREENQLFVKEIRTFIDKHVRGKGGSLVKHMGDGFLITFDSPTNAVACGLEMQREIERRNANILDEDNFVRLRIGISTGEVNIDEKGDVYGDAVNIAARIQKFAEPNEVFISDATYLAMNKSEVKALDLGPQRFKNVMQQVRVYKVLKGIKDYYQPVQKNIFKNKFILGTGIAGLIIIALFLIYHRKAKEVPPTTMFGSSKFKDRPFISPESRQFTHLGLDSGSEKIEGEKKLNKFIKWGENQLKKDPNNVRLLWLVAQAYIRIGDVGKAKMYLERAVKIAPDVPSVFYRKLAAIYEKEGNYREAIEMLRKYSLKEKNRMLRKKALKKIRELEKLTLEGAK